MDNLKKKKNLLYLLPQPLPPNSESIFFGPSGSKKNIMQCNLSPGAHDYIYTTNMDSKYNKGNHLECAKTNIQGDSYSASNIYFSPFPHFSADGDDTEDSQSSSSSSAHRDAEQRNS